MSGKPKFSRRQVVTTLVGMLEAGAHADKVAQALAGYLVETRQTRNLELYLRDLELAVRQRLGVATAYLYTAKQASAKTRKQVEQLVKDKTGAAKVELVEKTDPDLIGGVIVRMADAELDGSVRTKIRNLRSI